MLTEPIVSLGMVLQLPSDDAGVDPQDFGESN
jgi:hypothetical protein